MARYGYMDGKNPTKDFFVKENGEGKFYIAVTQYCQCGHPCCSKPEVGDRPHTNGTTFDEYEDAAEWIEAVAERFEEDYDNYLEENSYAIRQSELYEMWRNEY